MAKPMPIETAPAADALEKQIRILIFCADDKKWCFGRVTQFEDHCRIVSGDGRTGDWVYTHWLPEPATPE